MAKHKGSGQVGYIKFDADLDRLGPTTCSMVTNKDAGLERGTYVKIMRGDDQFYVGQIIDGPYFTKIGEKVYETNFLVELNATIRGDVQAVVLDRPEPNTPVYPLEEKLIQEFLGTTGVFSIGKLLTQEFVNVLMDPMSLTRHIGIFGTTGGGKSNTIQTLMEEAYKDDFAVLVFDVEGEYVMMDDPTDKLHDLLAKFNYKPRGVEDLNVYLPNPATSHRKDPTKFSISFKNMDKRVLGEVSGLNRMEQLYFFDLIEKVEAIAPAFRKVTLDAVIERLKGRLEAQADNPTMPGYIAEAHTSLYSKLVFIQSLDIVDSPADFLDVSKILVPRKISVVDLGDAAGPVRNIVIANLLHDIFKYKMAHPDSPKLLLVLEEAHTFISRERREEMMATLGMMLELARRGRKRGLCLGIVTQQPAHLPPEILELCNVRVMHRMSSTVNIDVLRGSTGNVPESLWKILPSLGQGQSIIASPSYSRAIVAQIRPAASKRMATEFSLRERVSV